MKKKILSYFYAMLFCCTSFIVLNSFAKEESSIVDETASGCKKSSIPEDFCKSNTGVSKPGCKNNLKGSECTE